MDRQEHTITDGFRGTVEGAISRRVILASSALTFLDALSCRVLAAESEQGTQRKGPSTQAREPVGQSQDFAERLRNATGREERRKFVEERMAAARRLAVEGLKDGFAVSDQEWAVIRPRIEVVYNLLHPLPQTNPEQKRTEVQERSAELRAVLRNRETPVDEVKAKLTALRGAKEKARRELAAAQQNLRQLLTVRQEATLVLSGLLD